MEADGQPRAWLADQIAQRAACARGGVRVEDRVAHEAIGQGAAERAGVVD